MARFSWRQAQAQSARSIRGRVRKPDARPAFSPYLETLENRCLLAACAANDAGSLEACIQGVNNGSYDAINLSGVIKLQNNLDPIFNPVTIIGPAGDVPQAFIEPVNTGFASVGLEILGGSSTVANLGIGGFTGFGSVGLFLSGDGGDTVQGCYLGFGGDDGLAPDPNNEGMVVGGSGSATIGGTMPGLENVIANNGYGLEIQSGAANNHIIGNIIGTDEFDSGGEGNSAGLVVESAFNTIGGTSPLERNLVSGNRGAGINLIGATNNLVEGNYIGTTQDGSHPLPNGVGIVISSSITASTCAQDPVGNTIGGTFGTSAGNLISGNLDGGIQVSLSDCNVISGDVIGLDPTGTMAIPNSLFGISVSAGTSNTIGGTLAADRDVVSGNQGDGVQLSGDSNLVDQDYIGTDFTGMHAFPNSGSGVVVANGQTNLIGGVLTDPRIPHNLVSANGQSGIQILGQAVGTMVQGNFIGTDVSGTQPLGNATDASTGLLLNAGVSVSSGAAFSCIGGTFMGGSVNACLGGSYLSGTQISEYRNVISANQGPDDLAPGVSITSVDTGTSLTTTNLVAGNFIGTDWSGTLTSYRPDPLSSPVSLGNGRGVYIWGRASNNVVGDPTPRGATMTLGNRNLITGNLYSGVAISDRGTTNNKLYSNYIGTDISGTLFQDANGVRYGNGEGVDIFDGASANQVGGYIQPDQTHGVVPPDTSLNSADIFGHGNLIVGSLREGVRIYDRNTSQNLVQGNLIGNYIDPADGIDKPLGNDVGVRFAGAASNNLAGGTVVDTIAGQDYLIPAGNTISGNTEIGVAIGDELTYGNLVEGNMIGPDPTGTKAVVRQIDANTDVTVQATGVLFEAGAGNPLLQLGNTLGGTAPLSRNIITGNVRDGVTIQGVSTQYNVVLGNYIGTDVTGTDYLRDPYHPLVNISNGGNGVSISFFANDNAVGGTATGAGNTIAFNHQYGVWVDAATGDAILGNTIYANGSFNIELTNGGNDNQAPPLLTAATTDGSQVVITGTLFGSPDTTFTLQFFSGDNELIPEGRYFLGSASVRTDASGMVDFTITLPVGVGQDQFITATATDPSNNTSRFSPSVAVGPAGP